VTEGSAALATAVVAEIAAAAAVGIAVVVGCLTGCRWEGVALLVLKQLGLWLRLP